MSPYFSGKRLFLQELARKKPATRVDRLWLQQKEIWLFILGSGLGGRRFLLFLLKTNVLVEN